MPVTATTRRLPASPRTGFATGTPDPVDVHVGARIRTARVERGLSQEKLADAIGITFQQVQKYERGTNRVAASRLHAMAVFFEVPHGYFFEGLGEPAKPTRGLTRGRLQLELMRNFQRIPCAAQRASVHQLVRALAVNEGAAQ